MSSLSYQLTQVSEDTSEIAPYFDEKYFAAIKRLMASPVLPHFVKDSFPKVDMEAFIQFVLALGSVDEFQEKITFVAVKTIVKKTVAEFTSAGWHAVNAKDSYLYISNHRDIICDPSLFAWAGRMQKHRTPQICLGDNLLQPGFLTDLIKVNKGVTVKRKLSQRELLRWSKVLSSYLRSVIEKGADSIWLAQREGRSKDGIDKTNTGVLKMLALSDRQDVAESFRKLKIVPMAISYELDPLDAWKAWEAYWTEVNGSYEKKAGEDIKNAGRGILGQKGRVHLQLATPIGEETYQKMAGQPRPQAIDILAQEIDKQIARAYKLWPTHYIARDLLKNSSESQSKYTAEEKKNFETRLEAQLAALPSGAWDKARMRELILLSYANSVDHCLP